MKEVTSPKTPLIYYYGIVILVLILFIPNMHGLFSIGPITLTQFFIVVGLSLATFVIVQITKVIQYRG